MTHPLRNDVINQTSRLLLRSEAIETGAYEKALEHTSQALDPDQANLISSLAWQKEVPAGRLARFSENNYWHNPIFDFDFPVMVVPSATPGHHHVYLDLPQGILWEDYVAIMEAMAKAGLLQKRWVELAKARGMACLRLPGVPKKPITSRPDYGA